MTKAENSFIFKTGLRAPEFFCLFILSVSIATRSSGQYGEFSASFLACFDTDGRSNLFIGPIKTQLRKEITRDNTE